MNFGVKNADPQTRILTEHRTPFSLSILCRGRVNLPRAAVYIAALCSASRALHHRFHCVCRVFLHGMQVSGGDWFYSLLHTRDTWNL